ncbi:MAG: GntR family transcriptional regulator [Anaerolineaceae bacterium]|nr:GntR family transcriptional regulator [Anaerolineaceae bacterium]
MLDGLTPTKTYLTKEEFIFNSLREAIMQCKILPGERLVIDHLSEVYKVSSIPIRTVLQRLQAEGLVDIIPHTGAVVSGISLDTIDELFTILSSLENIAFSVAVRKITEQDIADLERIMVIMDRAAEQANADEWSDYNRIFHIRIAEIAQMNILIDFTKRIFDQWERIRRFYLFKEVFAHRLPQSQNDHRDMFELLKQHKAAELTEKTSQHNTLAKNAYQTWINTTIVKDQPTNR